MSTRTVMALAAGALLAACASAPRRPAILAANAQGRSVPVDSLTISYDAGGVRVIQRPAPSNDAFAVNLYLLGGARQLTPATAGIEELLLTASEYGSRRYPGGASHRALARTGSQFFVDAEPDWTVVALRGLVADFDSSWAVFADRVMAPALDSEAVAQARARLVADIRRTREVPDLLVQRLGDSAAFAGHPYGIPVDGTERTLAALDSAALARYLDAQMVTSRMLLVVVGNVPRATLDSAVRATLARLPRGGYAWTMPPALPALAGNAPVLVSRDSPTNYIYGVLHGPPATSRDYAVFEVAMSLLSSRLDDLIRQERGLSYAAYAPFDARAIAVGGEYASTTKPREVIPLMRKLLGDLQAFDPPEYAMHNYVRHFITDYYLTNESNAAQADAIARAALFDGDPRATAREESTIESVTAADIRRVAHDYLREVQFVYVGNVSGSGR